MSKNRAYFENRDRVIIAKWAKLKPDIPFILQKVNEERTYRGAPTFSLKLIKSELKRGTPEGKTIREYDANLASSHYKMGKNKNIPFFDVRSIIPLRWFIVYCRMNAKEAYNEYKRLFNRETCRLLKLHSLFDVEWLIRHGYATVNDVALFNRINLQKVQLRGRVPPSEIKFEAVESYLRENPNEGRYPLYGEIPLGYSAVDEVVQEPLTPEETSAPIKIAEEPVSQNPKIPTETLDIGDADDVVTINLPAGSRIRIINTDSKPRYQLSRKDNDYIIII